MFRLISILLFSLEMFTSFHTYLRLHSGALGAWALSWHLTNTCDRGRITTRVWNRSRSALAIVNSAGSEIARFLSDTAVHHPIQSVFLISHQSELLRTASDNLQKSQPQGVSGLGSGSCYSFHFHNHSEKVTATICCAGRSIDCKISMIHHVKVGLLILLYLAPYTRSSLQLFLSPTHTLLSAYCSGAEH